MSDKIVAQYMAEPKEEDEQIALFRWAAYNVGKWPELKLLIHIPNGGKRSKAEAARFKAMGVKAGVSDIFLPVARGGNHGLWVELKRLKSGRLSADQAEWIQEMTRHGYAATVCRGWQQAAKVISDYLRLEAERINENK